MTVRELITRLCEFDGDLRVVRDCDDFMLFVKTVDLVVDDGDPHASCADGGETDLQMPSVVLIS